MTKTMQRSTGRQRGFTLIEVMVVVVILVMLVVQVVVQEVELVI